MMHGQGKAFLQLVYLAMRRNPRARGGLSGGRAGIEAPTELPSQVAVIIRTWLRLSCNPSDLQLHIDPLGALEAGIINSSPKAALAFAGRLLQCTIGPG